MGYLGALLFVTNGSKELTDLCSGLRFAGFAVDVAPYLEKIGALPRQGAADVVILDHRDRDSVFADCRSLRQRPEFSDSSFCLLTEEATGTVCAEAFQAQFDDLFSPPFEYAKLKALLRPLVQLSRMKQELRLRADKARQFGVAVDAEAWRSFPETSPRILLTGENVEDYSGLFPNAELILTSDAHEARTFMEQSNLDAVIVIPGRDIEGYLDICTQARKNPGLFNLPVIVLDQDGFLQERQAYQKGASLYLAPPFNREIMDGRLSLLVRVQKTRWSIRERLRLCLGRANGNNAGIYNRAFLETCLDARINAAEARPHYLSLVVVRVFDIERIRRDYGDESGDSLHRQISQWISRLIRAEDLCAALSDTEFAIVLVDTQLDQTTVVTNRIAGVLSQTEFSAIDVFWPIRVSASVGVADLEEADSAKALIQAALDKTTDY